MKENNIPVSAIIMIVIVYSIIIIFTYVSFKANPMSSYLGLSMTLVLVTLIFIDNFEWNPLAVNMNVIGANGEIGTIVKPIAMQYSITIACKKRYAPQKKFMLPGLMGVMSHFTGNTNIELRGYRTDFLEINPSGTCPEGAILYMKNIKQLDEYCRLRNYSINYDRNKKINGINKMNR